MAAEKLGYLQIMPQCFNRGVCVWHVCGVCVACVWCLCVCGVCVAQAPISQVRLCAREPSPLLWAEGTVSVWSSAERSAIIGCSVSDPDTNMVFVSQ